MPWIIDTDVLIEGERGNSAFLLWITEAEAIATADIIRGEFLLGVYAVRNLLLRERGLRFYSERVARFPSLPSDPSDFVRAAELAGKARQSGHGMPGLVDGLIAAIALRTGAKVATRNLKDFEAMGCPCENPLVPPERS